MKFLITLVLILSLYTYSVSSATYAVLAAGSKGYSNYRHQSDICHAYHIMINNGVPRENIIVFAYNDIAHNPMNPMPGTIFNQPSVEGEPSPQNVYEGCVIDYQGIAVTPENYIAVLTGDKNAIKGGTGRVLESGPEDFVFLNFDDHGEPGIIDFPEIGEFPYLEMQRLYADELNDAFKVMKQKKMYKEITYYLETCYSGSMFEETPSNTQVYALSAANPNQSSWATYCTPDNVVEGISLRTCLGDLFSVNWMENTEQSNTTKTTLQEQFESVKELTQPTADSPGSEVMQWGDLSFTYQTIGTFLGNQNQKSYGFLSLDKIFRKSQFSRQGLQSNSEVNTNYLLKRFKEEPTEENYSKLEHDLITTQKYNLIFKNFEQRYGFSYQNQPETPKGTNFECYRYLLNQVESQFGTVNEYSKKQLLHLYKFCKYANYHAVYESVTFSLQDDEFY